MTCDEWADLNQEQQSQFSGELIPMKIKNSILGLTFSMVTFLGHGQYRLDLRRDTTALLNYVSALESGKARHEYFYGLYLNNTIRSLSEKDSLLIHKLLSRPNSFPDQYSHFFTSYLKLSNPRPRKDSVIFHGYLPSRSLLFREYNDLKAWSSIRIKYEVPKVIRSMTSPYNMPVTDVPTVYPRERRFLPYYERVNRYDFMYKLKGQ